MDHDDLVFPTIIFEPPSASPDRHRRRYRDRHRRVLPFPFRDDGSTDSATNYTSDSDPYSSADEHNDDDDDDDDRLGTYPYHHRRPRRRHRHRHIHLPAGLPLSVPNALVRRPAAAAAAAPPRNYGYRRLHYQGGQERRGRRRTRTTHCHANEARGRGGPRSPRRNILVRCGRWLFGESGRCYCGHRGCGGGCCAPATGCCDNERGGSRSPTRHLEEEHWGPGTQNWAYGPPGRNAQWRDTPWSSGGAGAGTANMYNLGPGGVVEEVEEGGTLPTTTAIAAVADRTHNHYHIGADGRGRRSSRRRGVRSGRRDHGVLGLVNQERDRELARNMADRQTADWERERELDRNMMDRETAKQRDRQLLTLLDREREQELKGTMVDRDTTKQRDNRLLTLLDRERDRDRGGKDILELLDQELERRRDLHPEISTNRRRNTTFETAGESSRWGEAGLREEMEALRNDFRKLMRSTSKTRGEGETKKAKGGVSAVSSVASRSSGRQKPSADIQFSHERMIDDTDDDENENEHLDESATSSRRVFGYGGSEQAYQLPLPTDEASDYS